jgi:hypothetical protein
LDEILTIDGDPSVSASQINRGSQTRPMLMMRLRGKLLR